MGDETVERRLLTLESAVSELQRQTNRKPVPESWLEELIGYVSDEAAFLEALEYGRSFRYADRPLDERNHAS